MEIEFIDIVNEQNELLGIERTKEYAHEKALWHRSVHVWIFNKKGDILFQKRATSCKIFPGLFDITAASHLNAGDDYDRAAIRLLFEELSVQARFGDLISLGVTPWQKDFNYQGNKIKNREFRKIYLLCYDGKISDLRPDKGIISEVRFYKQKELKEIFSSETKKNEFVPHPDEYYSLIIAAVNSEAKRYK